MAPAEGWAVEIGAYLPISLWRVENPDIPEGELVAYRGTRKVAALAVDGLDTLPPPTPAYPTCAP